eukprot:15808836-Heterocapsa_arctica.AAC.1
MRLLFRVALRHQRHSFHFTGWPASRPSTKALKVFGVNTLVGDKIVRSPCSCRCCACVRRGVP